jgi:2-polyprenyl-3-methyl-5-hydroxy-6-metoxy-1,4-benzoquinol methylase
MSSRQDLFVCPACGADFDPEQPCSGCGEEIPITATAVRDFLAQKERSLPAQEVEAFYDIRPFPGYAPGDSAGSIIDRSRQSNFLDSLDQAIPVDATVLDAGCGTGQLVSFLALAASGRRVVGIDGCKASLGEADGFRQRVGIPNLTLARGDLFHLPLRPESFDVVISRGVVHHTEDPYGVTHLVAKLVRPGGIFLLGYYETFGRSFHCTRRFLSKLRGRPIRILDPILRARNLDEEKKKTWIADQYHHPLERILPTPVVVKELEKAGFQVLRTVPPAIASGGMFDARPVSGASLFARRVGWALSGIGDPDAGLVCVIARKS